MIPIIHSARLELIPMTPAVLRALLAEDSREAGELLGVAVTAAWHFPRGAIERRLIQLETDPGLQPWLLRAIVLREERIVIGNIGFHTAPGAEYLREHSPDGVEFGYRVLGPWRRQGIATEATGALMRWAGEIHGVKRFVVSISPDNAPSLGLAAKLGFRKIGSHIDEIDGPEDIFERTEAAS